MTLKHSTLIFVVWTVLAGIPSFPAQSFALNSQERLDCKNRLDPLATELKVKYIGRDTKAFVDSVIHARDPEDKFKDVEAVKFPLKLWGPFFELQDNQEAFGRSDVNVTVWTKKRKVVFENFPKPGFTSVYLEEEAYTLSPQGNVVKHVDSPLNRITKKAQAGGLAFKAKAYEEFEGGGVFGLLATPFHLVNEFSGNPLGRIRKLSPLEQMSFMSYALINYITFPNNLRDPTKVKSVEKTGINKIKVIYNRESFPTNSKVQSYVFDPHSRLLALHFYQVSYISDEVSAWHRTASHKFSDGIAFANRRRVRVSLTGQASANSKKAISGDFGDFEVFYEDPDKN